jgi:protein phosphatase
MMSAAVPHKANLSLEVASLSNRGKKRHLNEDAIFDLTTSNETGTHAGLYLVCDGVGGEKAGNVASQMAVETVVAELVPFMSRYQAMQAYAPSFIATDMQHHIKGAVNKANTRIRSFKQQKHLDEQNTSTTLTMAYLQDQEAIVANVGHSRAYVWHKGHLTQITHDCEEDDDVDCYEPYNPSHWRESVSQSVGTNSTVKVDLFEWGLEAGDKLLLCSDGLWQAFASSDELGVYLNTDKDAHDICRQLIFEANRRDGSDNISVVVICAEASAVA